MATERIEIVINVKGDREVVRRIGGIGRRADRSRQSVLNLKNALLGFSAFQIGRGLVSMADEFTNLQNRLRNVTSSGEEVVIMQKALIDVAKRTYSPVAAIAEIYARVAFASKGLGYSQLQLLNFTEAVNQAAILGGATAKEAVNGLIQLSQAISSDVLGGEEYKAVREQLPVVLDAMLQHLGISKAEFRALSEAKKIGTEEVVGSFTGEGADKLAKRFIGEFRPTIERALINLKTKFQEFWDEVYRGANIRPRAVAVIDFIGDQIKELTITISGLLAGLLAFAGVEKILNLVSTPFRILGGLLPSLSLGLRGIWTVLSGIVSLNMTTILFGFRHMLVSVLQILNPLGLIRFALGAIQFALAGSVGLLIAAGAAAYAWGDKFKLAKDNSATLRDFMTVLLDKMKEKAEAFGKTLVDKLGDSIDKFKDLRKTATTEFGVILIYVSRMLDLVTVRVQLFATKFLLALASIKQGWYELRNQVAQNWLDQTANLVLANVPRSIGQPTTTGAQIYNWFIGWRDAFENSWLSNLRAPGTGPGAANIEYDADGKAIPRPRKQSQLLDVGQIAATTLIPPVNDVDTDHVKAAQEVLKLQERIAELSGREFGLQNLPEQKGLVQQITEEVLRLSLALDKISEDAGEVSDKKPPRTIAEVDERLQRYNLLISKLEEQNDALRIQDDLQREVFEAQNKFRDQLNPAGDTTPLKDFEGAAVANLVEQRYLLTAKNELLKQALTPGEERLVQERLIGKLFEKRLIDLKTMQRLMANLALETPQTFGEGLRLGIKNITEQAEGLNAEIGRTLVESTSRFGDAMVDAANRGSVAFRDMIKAIGDDLIRLYSQKALMALLSLGAQAVSRFGGGGGGTDEIIDNPQGIPGGGGGFDQASKTPTFNPSPAYTTASTVQAPPQAVTVQAPPVNVVVVNDPEEVPKGIKSASGQDAIMAVLMRNRGTIQAMVR